MHIYIVYKHKPTHTQKNASTSSHVSANTNVCRHRCIYATG